MLGTVVLCLSFLVILSIKSIDSQLFRPGYEPQSSQFWPSFLKIQI